MTIFFARKFSLASVLASVLVSVMVIGGASSAALASDDMPNKQAIEQIVQDYISNNPEVIVDALQKWQAAQQAQANAMQQQALSALPAAFKDRPLVHIAGNPDGDVTLYEFFDYNCGYCKKALPDLLKLIDTDKNLRVVMIELPILAETSMTAAQAATAAIKQDKYMAFHNALMQSRGQLSEGRLLEIAASAGLDPAKLAKDMRAPSVIQEIEKNYQIAKVLGVNSTPHFIVGDQVGPGAIGYDKLKAMIDMARANN